MAARVTIVVKHFEWPKMARKKEATSVNVAHVHVEHVLSRTCACLLTVTCMHIISTLQQQPLCLFYIYYAFLFFTPTVNILITLLVLSLKIYEK